LLCCDAIRTGPLTEKLPASLEPILVQRARPANVLGGE
jgi:hypothetical protein